MYFLPCSFSSFFFLSKYDLGVFLTRVFRSIMVFISIWFHFSEKGIEMGGYLCQRIITVWSEAKNCIFIFQKGGCRIGVGGGVVIEELRGSSGWHRSFSLFTCVLAWSTGSVWCPCSASVQVGFKKSAWKTSCHYKASDINERRAYV